jgi:hypothetical protein
MLVRTGADQTRVAPAPIRLSILLRVIPPWETSMEGSSGRTPFPLSFGEAFSKPSNLLRLRAIGITQGT